MPAQFITRIAITGRQISTAHQPAGLVLREELEILAHESLYGQLANRAEGTLFEYPAAKRPRSDYLPMFPTDTQGGDLTSGMNCHYNGKTEKVNDLVAYRSTDRGTSWKEPEITFDIDYNQG